MVLGPDVLTRSQPIERTTVGSKGSTVARVAVGMSGGVDSAVAAALLLEQGYHVVGITMKLWSDQGDHPRQGRRETCCSLSAAEDARRVADRLGFPHFTLNFEEVFHDTVLRDFLTEYMHGRTPHPCARCNQFVKFAALLHKARALEANDVATGHYARVAFDPQRGRYVLRRGLDPAKDQSYTLYSLSQELLARVHWPLGGWTKERVRDKARFLGLRVAHKPDSQELCFLPGNDYRDFLREMAGDALRPGPIISHTGKVLGEHQGLAFYTIGQRRGLRISAPEPLYVVELDLERNAVIVGPEAALFRRRFRVTQINYVSIPPLTEPREAEVMVRYRTVAQPATVRPTSETSAEVSFHTAQRAITPGQSAVFYAGDEVLGGGRIQTVEG